MLFENVIAIFKLIRCVHQQANIKTNYKKYLQIRKIIKKSVSHKCQ